MLFEDGLPLVSGTYMKWCWCLSHIIQLYICHVDITGCGKL